MGNGHLTAQCGGSPKTVTSPASRSMSDIIPAIGMPMAVDDVSSSDPVKASCSEPMPPMPCLFGDNSSTIAGKKASTAQSSATRATSSRRSLSDRLTRSLITSGLVAGITPTSVRKTFGLAIRDFASLPLAGDDAEKRKADCSFSNDSHSECALSPTEDE